MKREYSLLVTCSKDSVLAKVLAAIERLVFVRIQKTDARLETYVITSFVYCCVGLWFHFACFWQRREFFKIFTSVSSKTSGLQTARSVTRPKKKRNSRSIVNLELLELRHGETI